MPREKSLSMVTRAVKRKCSPRISQAPTRNHFRYLQQRAFDAGIGFTGGGGAEKLKPKINRNRKLLLLL